MGRLKEYYHEQINEGMSQPVAEPYLFKYFVHFMYMGEAVNIFADTHKRILELAKQAVPEITSVRMSEKPHEFAFITSHMDIPFMMFDCSEARY